MVRLYTFLIFSAIIVVLGYILFVLPQFDHVSQTRFLIVPQNTKIASNANATVNDIVLIARMSTKDIESARVDVERLKEHNIIILSVFSHDPKDVMSTEKKAITAIVRAVEKYYVIDQDVSFKVLAKDAIAQKTVISTYAVYVTMVAIAIGVFAAVMLLLSVIDRIREDRHYEGLINGKRVFEKYQKDIVNEKSKDDHDVVEINKQMSTSSAVIESEEEVEDEPMNDMEKEDVREEKISQENSEQKEIMPSGLPTTPGNLPVVDLEEVGFSSEDAQSSQSARSQEKEPTEEELKARLNELLNGKL